MAGRHRLCQAAALALSWGLASANAETNARLALVIGNNTYLHLAPPLSNPASDAGKLADVLRKAGFDVDLETNLDAYARNGDELRAEAAPVQSLFDDLDDANNGAVAGVVGI